MSCMACVWFVTVCVCAKEALALLLSWCHSRIQHYVGGDMPARIQHGLHWLPAFSRLLLKRPALQRQSEEEALGEAATGDRGAQMLFKGRGQTRSVHAAANWSYQIEQLADRLIGLQAAIGTRGAIKYFIATLLFYCLVYKSFSLVHITAARLSSGNMESLWKNLLVRADQQAGPSVSSEVSDLSYSWLFVSLGSTS